MRLRTLVLREIFERKSQLATSFLAILLGITVIVSIKNITVYSEKAVAKWTLWSQHSRAAKSATLRTTMQRTCRRHHPGEYVTQLTMSSLQGLDNLSQTFGAGGHSGTDFYFDRYPAQSEFRPGG